MHCGLLPANLHLLRARTHARRHLFDTFIAAPSERSGASSAADVALERFPAELAALSRLRRLQHLQLLWPGLHVGAALAPEWLQPGVWRNLKRCAHGGTAGSA